MPNEFVVVGEHRDNDSELLVLGADGRYYEYDPVREVFIPTEPDENWEMFPDAEDTADNL